MLIGGKKTGNDRWYKAVVPIAERLYREHLHEVGKNGVDDDKKV